MTFWELFQFSFLAISLISAAYYVFTHYANIRGWNKLNLENVERPNLPVEKGNIFFSILIPARNEAANILSCLQTVFNQDYPESAFEVILLDDHSTDETINISKAHFGQRLKIIQLEGEETFGKKAALLRGINLAKGDWIATTDADCQVPSNWLKTLAETAQKSTAIFVGGPVIFKTKSPSILAKFQQLDLIGMMGVTAGGIQRGAAYLANGAHLAYKKSAFEKVEGFKNVDQKASGDDMLLLHKLAKEYPQKIAYTGFQNNAVTTAPEPTWTAFYRQRLRWASKGNSFPNFSTWLQMVLVFLFCFSLISSIILTIWDPNFFGRLALVLFLIKVISDFFYLRFLCKKFNESKLITSIWWASLIHAGYITIVGISAQFNRKYVWKGRRVN